MIRMWRIIRRLIFLFVTLIVASNTIAFVILNNKLVHEWFRDQANERFFNKHRLSFDVGTIYVNFLENKLSVHNISISDVSDPSKQMAKLSSVTWGFDPWNPETWIPKARYLVLEDWMIDTALRNHFRTEDGAVERKEMNLSEVLSQLRGYIGQQLELKQGVIKDSASQVTVTELKVKNIFIKYDDEKKSDDITVVAEIDRSSICPDSAEACTSPIKLEGALFNLAINAQGIIRIQTFQMQSQYGDWKASGELKLGPSNKLKDYQFDLQGDADAAVWFNIARLNGRGRFSANLKVTSANTDPSVEDSKKLLPYINGKVAWKDLHLDGFDIYNGFADVSYSDFLIRYRDAKISTPTGAKIDAYGEYSLKEQMPFINHAKLSQMTFTELMAGLSVPTDVLNFNMDTRELVVSGEINPKGDRGFILLIQGPVQTTQMIVPSFQQKRRRLPDCDVNLRLESDTHRMTFKGSSLVCDGEYGDEKAEFELQKGLLDYSRGKQEFLFTGSSVPGSVISYFVDKDVAGSMDMRSSIIASKEKEVVFTSEVQLTDGEIFNVDVPKLSGTIEIDKSHLIARDVEGWLEDDRPAANVRLKRLKLGFKNQNLEMDGDVSGKISDVMSLLGEKGESLSQRVQGTADISKIRIKGRYHDLANAEIQAKVRLRQMVSPVISARDIQAAFHCQYGWCSESRIFAQDLSLGQSKLNRAKAAEGKNFGVLQSKAIIEVDSFSEKSLSVRADLQSIPFKTSVANGISLAGKIDMRGQLQGGWSDWEMSTTARLDDLILGDQSLGSVVATASSHGGGPLNLVMSGIFDQAQARLVFDHDLKKSTEIYMSVRSLEIFKYIPSFINGSRRVTGAVTAEMSMDGPGLKKLFGSTSSVVPFFDGRGFVRQARINIGDEGFTLSEPTHLLFEEGVLSFSQLALKGANGEIKSGGRYSFAEGALLAGIQANMDAGFLANVTTSISQGTGNVSIRGDLSLDENGVQFRGDSRLENIFLAGRYLSPPITALNGKLIFQGTKIEIPQMTATKGNGQIDLVGSVDLQPESDDESLSEEPALALRANIRGAQFRWPQDLFETVETTVDGQIELVGRGRPYLLNGDVRVTKGRAYRDATCQELFRVGANATSAEASIATVVKPLIQLNLAIEADNNFTLQTSCIRGRMSTALKITGSEVEPVVAGQLRLDNGQLTLLKTRFEVTRADAFFDNLVRVEPRLEAQMVAKIDKYSVFVGAEGPLSRPRLNIWSDPSTGPDGMPLSRQTLIRMISTNRGPEETTQTAVTQALANGVVGFFDDPLSQAVSRITRGFVDRFELQPILESGQSSWRARVSRDLGEKFNLGLDFEPNSQSLTGEIFINESVNVLGGFDRRSTQIGTYSEFKGGFRFQFGGK